MRPALALALLPAMAAPAAGADLPRVAGVVIAPGERVALFDLGSGGLRTVGVGDAVAGFRVGAIERSGVRLDRDGQTTTVHTGTARRAPPPADTGGGTFGLVLRSQPPVDD